MSTKRRRRTLRRFCKAADTVDTTLRACERRQQGERHLQDPALALPEMTQARSRRAQIRACEIEHQVDLAQQWRRGRETE
jgi:hypothetical protein